MSAGPEFKIGDPVAIKRAVGHTEIRAIDRLTPKQVVIGGRRFRRDDGLEIGSIDAWSPAWIVPATKADYEEEERLQIIDRLKRVDWWHVPFADLKAVATTMFAPKLRRDGTPDCGA